MIALQIIGLSFWSVLSGLAIYASFGDPLYGFGAGTFLMAIGLDAIFAKD